MSRTTRATVYLPLRRWIPRACGAVLLAWLGAHGSWAQVVPVDRLVAVVEQRALTAGDLRLATRLGSIPGGATDETALVEQLVARELMRIEVDRFAIPEPAAEAVEARIAALAGQRPLEAWRAEVLALGVSSEDIERSVADDLRITAYLDQRFTAAAQPTDTEVAARAAADGGVSPERLASARRALVAERTQALVAEWVSGLRRRAAVRVVARS